MVVKAESTSYLRRSAGSLGLGGSVLLQTVSFPLLSVVFRGSKGVGECELWLRRWADGHL